MMRSGDGERAIAMTTLRRCLWVPAVRVQRLNLNGCLDRRDRGTAAAAGRR